ncbi:hypothetical protein C8Q76DRAFT_746891 [Earliella scabrosa]|nr:hypothetical protein C8Q76DRAFT_746891 [Earliella scabrosa]
MSSTPPRIRIRCGQCKEEFNSRGESRNHKRVSGHSMNPMYWCDVCERTFLMKNERAAHIDLTGHMRWGLGPGVSRIGLQFESERVVDAHADSIDDHIDASKVPTWSGSLASRSCTSSPPADPQYARGATAPETSFFPPGSTPGNGVKADNTKSQARFAPPQAAYDCRACHKIPTDPVVALCGHLFCHRFVVPPLWHERG